MKAVASSLLQRFEFELEPGYDLQVEKLPTLSPRGGLPVVLQVSVTLHA